MPSAPATRQVVVDPHAPPELTIVWWPLRDEPLPAVATLTFALLAGIGAGVVAASWFVGLVSVAALLFALRNWWLPTTFRLNGAGVQVTCNGRSWRTPWREMAGFEVRVSGVWLLCDDLPWSIGLPRGIYIPFERQRSALVQILQYHLPSGDVVGQVDRHP